MSTTSTLNLVFPQESETFDFEPKIFSTLNEYLQPSSEVPPAIAAQEITQLYPTDPASQQPGTYDTEAYDFLLRLWELFIAIAEQIPWQHSSQDKVIELVKAIRDLPNPTTITFDNGFSRRVKLWTDLPVLAAVLTDNVETHGIIINDDSDEEKKSRLRDINFQGFAARLTAEGVWDLSRLGVYRLRAVLEEGPDYYIAGYDKVGPHIDACILPAEVWISLSAKVILRFCRANGDGADRNDLPGGEYWKGKEGFSVERWEFWKQRLDEIMVNKEVSEETRSVAKKMKEKMIATEAEA